MCGEGWEPVACRDHWGICIEMNDLITSGSGRLPMLVTILSPWFVITLNPLRVGIVTLDLRFPSPSARPALVTVVLG